MFGGGACTYEGDWVEDEWSGQGRLECRGAGSAAAVDGPELELQVYTGAFHRGARHGEGRAEYASGAWAQGKFRNDSLVEVCAAAVREQRGPWLIVWVGVSQGELHYPDGSVYSGQLRDGVPHGAGKLEDKSGDVYQVRAGGGSKRLLCC